MARATARCERPRRCPCGRQLYGWCCCAQSRARPSGSCAAPGTRGPCRPGTRPQRGFPERHNCSRTVDEVRAALAPLFHNLALVTPEMVDRLYRYKQEPDVTSVLQELGSQLVRDGEALVDFQPRLNAIRARTLVVWGREDRLIPVSHLDHVQAIPNVRTHIFEDCGHIPQVEMSEAFNNLLMEFLTSP